MIHLLPLMRRMPELGAGAVGLADHGGDLLALEAKDRFPVELAAGCA